MSRTRYIAQAGLIAAVYAGLTLLVVQIGGVLTWGPLQLRISEALTVLAALTPAAIPGLWLGVVIANALSMTSQVGALGLLDVVFGGLATLLGAVWTWHFRKRTALALFGPVLFNALIVPAYLPVLLGAMGLLGATYHPVPGIDARGTWAAMYAFGVVGVAIGEAIVVYGLGWPLLVALRRLRLPGLFDEER